ncbi:MAG TPA: ROK family protein [Ilumatobacter sp.]
MSLGFLAIDLGPSRLAVGVVDGDGTIVLRDRLTTPPRNVWPALTQLVRRVLAANPGELELVGVGVTCPGTIDRGTGAMKPVGMPMWHDFPLRRELAQITGLPVSVDTAGRGLARAELWCGESAALAPADQQFATLVLGDDVDGALVVNGRLAEGLTGNLGQFGHLIVEPTGVECACGAIGCLTVYAGVRGIEASTGRDLRRTPPAIVERTGIMTARGCASIAAMLDVSEIVIGGVVPSVFGAPFFDALAVELDQRSGLAHLASLRVRDTGAPGLGPLVAAAALARHAVADGVAPSLGVVGRPASRGVGAPVVLGEAAAAPAVRVIPAGRGGEANGDSADAVPET